MQFSTENEKKAAIFSAAVIAIIFLYSLSLNFTGKLTEFEASKKLAETEKILNETRNSLLDAQKIIEAASKSLDSCERNLSHANSEEAKCGLSLLSSEQSLSMCINATSACHSDLALYRTKYDASFSAYNLLASSSSASICCSFSDFQSAMVRSWKIDDNRIVCNAGNLTVNCRTGETNI